MISGSAASAGGWRAARRGGPAPPLRPRRAALRARGAAGAAARLAAAPAPVSKEELWSTLLTTMPGLTPTGWAAGRLGEWETREGAGGAGGAPPAARGAILHLWRARLGAGGGGGAGGDDQGLSPLGPHPLEQPASVDISYYTTSSSDAGVTAAGGAPGDVVWDQAALSATATRFTFSPDAPQLSPSLAGWEAAGAPLHRVLRLLPLASSGLAIVNAALPDAWGAGLAAASPPGSYWFTEILLTHPDDDGVWQGSTLGVAFDWTTGQLSSYRYSWQKAVEPREVSGDDHARVVLPRVAPPARDGSASLGELLGGLAACPSLRHACTTYAYSSDAAQQLLCAQSERGAPDGDAPDLAELRALAAAAAASAAGAAGRADDAGSVMLWFPGGGCWARLPARIPSLADGAAAEPLEFEVGVLHGRGAGLSRAVLVYGADGGAPGSTRRLQAVRNDEWLA
ncbi:hypothetical protein HT031_004216 [Scenedesmus sp. PABB004]|nr:hypothetical protein HT031_004216 [Scenedesmus sp. PABB004]